MEADVCTGGPGQGPLGHFAVKQAHPGCSRSLLRETLAMAHIHSSHHRTTHTPCGGAATPTPHPHIVSAHTVIARADSAPDDTKQTLDPRPEAQLGQPNAETLGAPSGAHTHILVTSRVVAYTMEVFCGDLCGVGGGLSAEARWRVLAQCIDALLTAQAARVAHGDVKTANIFVRQDGSVALGDWASARLGADADSATDAPSGSPAYMAPEAWACYCSRQQGSRSRYRVFPADVWSLGVVSVQLALPAQWRRLIEADGAVRGEGPSRLRLRGNLARMHEAVRRECEPLTVRFVDRALDRNPRTRATLSELEVLARAAMEGKRGPPPESVRAEMPLLMLLLHLHRCLDCMFAFPGTAACISCYEV